MGDTAHPTNRSHPDQLRLPHDHLGLPHAGNVDEPPLVDRRALACGRGVEVAPVQTNIVVATLEGRSAPEVVARLREQGVLAIAMDARTLRLVTHRDVSRADCARAAVVVERALA